MPTTMIFALLATIAATAVSAEAKEARPHCSAPSVHRGALMHLRIEDGFSAYERGKLLQAVNEWNTALDGAARFDIVETAPADGAPAWLVYANRARAADAAPRAGRELALTLPSAAGGGMVLVNTAEIGSRDVALVMRHELGHVLGLCHDPEGGLMAAHYSPHEQGCIDRRTLAALAPSLSLPADRLHGCDPR